jgi:hypothetical protein
VVRSITYVHIIEFKELHVTFIPSSFTIQMIHIYTDVKRIQNDIEDQIK